MITPRQGEVHRVRAGVWLVVSPELVNQQGLALVVPVISVELDLPPYSVWLPTVPGSAQIAYLKSMPIQQLGQVIATVSTEERKQVRQAVLDLLEDEG